MPFRLIKGSFHVKGYSPDGDSIRFKADNLNNWTFLRGLLAKRNAREHAQLRFEGIDTLETHYFGHHQPLDYANQATDALFQELGIENVQWNQRHSKVVEASDAVPGYILSRSTDTYRRPIAFVFSGSTHHEDGSSVRLEAGLMKESVNYKLVEQGLAYPAFYKGLFFDLREEITRGVEKARQEGKGFWPKDKTNTGVEVTGLEQLEITDIIFPKLFRRIVNYIGDGGTIEGFLQFLADDPDPITILTTMNFTNLDTIVEKEGNQIKLKYPPEKIVFEPRSPLWFGRIEV